MPFQATAEAFPPSVHGVTARRFEFPDGSLYLLASPAARAGGTQSEVEVILPPNSLTPSPHLHPRQQETLTVTDGTLEVLVGRDWRTLKASETAAIPPGTVHTFRNRSAENVSFRCVHTPALEFERFLERLYWLSAMNRIRARRGVTSALYRSLLMDTHRDDQILAGAGARMRVRALAQIARLLRMRVDR